MSIIENIRLALSGIRASKMRSLLTMLGIIIGIASVIAIVTVGNSLTQSITGAMEELGANQITIFVSSKESNSNPKMNESDRITDEMIEDFEKKFTGKIQSLNTIEGGINGQVKNGRRYANVSVYGTDANYATENNIEIVKGTDLRDRDIQRSSNVVVVSTKFVEQIFPSNIDPIGQEIKVHRVDDVLTFTIIGVYDFKLPAMMASFMSEDDMPTEIMIPVTAAKRILDSESGYSDFKVHFPPEADSNELAMEIEDFFAEKYKNNPYFLVRTQNMESMLTQFTTMMTTVSLAISIIAMISLLVGGIGVMNIMLVSVTERTREIGTRKALGAKSNDIKIQFVVEALILCLIGGILGIILGLILGMGGAALLGFPASPSLGAIIFSVGSSMAIGVFFGYYPANKAAKLDPIEALRYE